MMWPIIIPVSHCSRCRLQYRNESESCPHCTHLTDRELTAFLAAREAEMRDAEGLGRVFIVLAALIALASIGVWITRI